VRDHDEPPRLDPRLVRIGEEKLVAVEILDHQHPVAPVAVPDGNAAGFELGAQRINRRDLGLVRRWLDVQGNEHQPPAGLLRPLLGEDEGRTLAVDFGDPHTAISLDAPRDREAEPVHIEAERGLDVRDVKHGAGEPLSHGVKCYYAPVRTGICFFD
jgi:hypothetical protein